METIQRDYADQGVGFYYVYKALAHPEWNGYVTPYTLEERLMHVAEAKRVLGTKFEWLCDTMDNSLKHAMGSAPNSEWVIDENNVIVRRRDWSNPDALRADLEELVGPVENPTTVADLNMPEVAPPQAAARNVVPRIEKPSRRMAPLHVTAHTEESSTPYYAKLRAEAERSMIEDGSGTLYLRFMLDPLYHVHWNNLTTPIQVKVDAPEGVSISQEVLIGPEVEVESDIDPREFLLDVSGVSEGQQLTLTAHYFACSDEQGWCRPVTQSYEVHFVRNRDGGSVIPDMMADRMPAEMNRRKYAEPDELKKSDVKGVGKLALVVGSWDMKTAYQGQEIASTMTLVVENGALVGTWNSQGMEMPLEDISFDGTTLSFTRTISNNQKLAFRGTLLENALEGKYTGDFGELESSGQRIAN